MTIRSGYRVCKAKNLCMFGPSFSHEFVGQLQMWVIKSKKHQVEVIFCLSINIYTCFILFSIRRVDCWRRLKSPSYQDQLSSEVKKHSSVYMSQALDNWLPLAGKKTHNFSYFGHASPIYEVHSVLRTDETISCARDLEMFIFCQIGAWKGFFFQRNSLDNWSKKCDWMSRSWQLLGVKESELVVH